jgi:hypothetical protein
MNSKKESKNLLPKRRRGQKPSQSIPSCSKSPSHQRKNGCKARALFPAAGIDKEGKRESPRAQAGTSCGIGETRTGTTAKARLPEREHSDGFQYGHTDARPF